MTVAASMSELDIGAFQQADVARREQAIDRAAHRDASPAPTVPAVAPKLGKPATSSSTEGCSLGIQVLSEWAAWLTTNRLGTAESTVALKKDAVRLLVHAYRLADGKTTCGVLKMDGSLSKTILDAAGRVVTKGESRIREFREWKQSLDIVTAKLRAKGWILQTPRT